MPPFKFRCTSALPSGHQNQFSSTLWTSNINHRPTNCDQSTALDPRTQSLPLRFPSETQTDYNQTMYLTKGTQTKRFESTISKIIEKVLKREDKSD